MRSLRLWSAAGLLLASASVASAEPVVVKLATLAPEGSVWHQALKRMGEEWARDTQGRVTLRIFPGGVAGDEPDMVRKMRLGSLQAASLSVIGLNQIDPAYNAFAIPMFFADEAEFVKIVAATEPEMRRRTEAKGFVLLGWGYGGTVHFFSKKPVRALDELKAVKMFASAGDDAWVTWWKNNGFHPVPLAATDILTGLQTGMIDGLPTTPLAALALQWFRQAPFMLDLPIAPLLGATVMPRKTWDRLSEADRAAVVAAARRVEQRLFAEVPKQDRAAVDEMAKRGLTVVRITPAEQAAWRTQAESFMATLRGMIDPAAFDLVHRERDAARRGR